VTFSIRALGLKATVSSLRIIQTLTHILNAIERQPSRPLATIRKVLVEMLNSLPTIPFKRTLDCFTEGEDNLMSCITLETTTGPEEYQVSELDAVVWWKTQTGVNVVGYMDVVAGLMSEHDLETCRIKRPEIVREILEEQASLPPRHSIH